MNAVSTAFALTIHPNLQLTHKISHIVNKNGDVQKHVPINQWKYKLRQPAGDYTSSWITRPERSFGSNHVVFGGMMLPVSAMSISCFIETG